MKHQTLGTKLYYATETFSGEALQLLSVSMESQRYDTAIVDDWPIYTMRDAGTVIFEIREQAMEFVRLFDKREKVAWTIEMPNHMSFEFDGYVEKIEQSLGMFAQSKIKVRIIDAVVCYYDGPISASVSTEDVFSRKYLRAASKSYGELLRRVSGQAD